MGLWVTYMARLARLRTFILILAFLCACSPAKQTESAKTTEAQAVSLGYKLVSVPAGTKLYSVDGLRGMVQPAFELQSETEIHRYQGLHKVPSLYGDLELVHHNPPLYAVSATLPMPTTEDEFLYAPKYAVRSCPLNAISAQGRLISQGLIGGQVRVLGWLPNRGYVMLAQHGQTSYVSSACVGDAVIDPLSITTSPLYVALQDIQRAYSRVEDDKAFDLMRRHLIYEGERDTWLAKDWLAAFEGGDDFHLLLDELMLSGLFATMDDIGPAIGELRALESALPELLTNEELDYALRLTLWVTQTSDSLYRDMSSEVRDSMERADLIQVVFELAQASSTLYTTFFSSMAVRHILNGPADFHSRIQALIAFIERPPYLVPGTKHSSNTAWTIVELSDLVDTVIRANVSVLDDNIYLMASTGLLSAINLVSSFVRQIRTAGEAEKELLLESMAAWMTQHWALNEVLLEETWPPSLRTLADELKRQLSPEELSSLITLGAFVSIAIEELTATINSHTTQADDRFNSLFAWPDRWNRIAQYLRD